MNAENCRAESGIDADVRIYLPSDRASNTAETSIVGQDRKTMEVSLWQKE